MLHIGFTGTQQGMTNNQAQKLETLLRRRLREGMVALHHGDCIGADEQAAILAKTLGCYLVSHPPTISTKRAFVESNETRPSKPYLERNLQIVMETTELVAAPKSSREELRSGTWSTIRRARKYNRPVHILVP